MADTPVHPIQIAPMIDVSHRDFRQFMRLLTARAQLWTEMIKDEAITFSLGDSEKLDRMIGFDDDVEHPVVFQLGGSDPATLAHAAEVVAQRGYDEINLNVGCPSDRVACRGEFGAALMKKPDRVRECIHQMQRRVSIPVTVKTRLGVDTHDSWEFTRNFVAAVAAGGCKGFVMHARRAWLQGLSPAQNRNVPPLNYGRVRRLCDEFPDLRFSINGGVKDLDTAALLLDARRPPNLDGVMLGRAAIDTPAIFHDADPRFYGCPPPETARAGRGRILDAYADYLEERYADAPAVGLRAAGAMRPCHHLFHGLPGARLFARTIETGARASADAADGRIGGVITVSGLLRSAIAAVQESHPEILSLPLSAASVPYSWQKRRREIERADETGLATLLGTEQVVQEECLRFVAGLNPTFPLRPHPVRPSRPQVPIQPASPPATLHGWWGEGDDRL
eukprot:Hpha_TRINITY_DN11070_c0_g1::TRINITY_DN11070_c0_g1_i1::g.92865::m.92865/K05539/dusA; tRNA-dihydrouridine synthase A